LAGLPIAALGMLSCSFSHPPTTPTGIPAQVSLKRISPLDSVSWMNGLFIVTLCLLRRKTTENKDIISKNKGSKAQLDLFLLNCKTEAFDHACRNSINLFISELKMSIHKRKEYYCTGRTSREPVHARFIMVQGRILGAARCAMLSWGMNRLP
jgi:hypothetical protein